MIWLVGSSEDCWKISMFGCLFLDTLGDSLEPGDEDQGNSGAVGM